MENEYEFTQQNNSQLIEKNIRLVYFVVSKEYPTYLRDEDIIQSGMLGLCKAAKYWDKRRSKFSTYATKCIRNEINQEFIRRKPTSKVVSLNTPIGEGDTLADVLVGESDIDYIDDSFYYQLTKAEQETLDQYNHGCSVGEIAISTGQGVQKIRKILRTIKLKWEKFND